MKASLIIGIVLVFGVAGSLLINKDNIGNLPDNVQKEGVDLVEDKTADWKVYTNEEYGFEFRYPKEYNFEEKREPQRDEIWLGGINTDDKGNMGILVKEQELDPNDIRGVYGKIDKIENVEISGIKSYRYMEGDAGFGGYTTSIPKDQITI